VTDEFQTWSVSDYPFDELLASARFEELGKGRKGAVLVKLDDRGMPVVRTTTQYRLAAQRFLDVHDRLARDLGAPFNNALIEHYTNAYSTMKRHSDQALDLLDGSSIAIYSCYRDPERPSRRLIVKPKESGAGLEITLTHGSVVAFSLDTNRRFTHTIALRERAPDNEWIGVTFRTSKTFVRFVDGQPWFPDGTRLMLADEDQRRDFFHLRRRENDETTFAYPSIPYTISESDLAPPSKLEGS
jgi:hypothetical protein